MSEQLQVVAVVVTWNRRNLLAEALRAVIAQTRQPERVVVVDNASTDGTAQLLATDFPDLDVMTTRRNVGGAGGFALGVARALDSGADLVWLLDDDTVPRPGALAALTSAWSSYATAAGEPPAVLASRVVWSDGRDHPMNTPRSRLGASRSSRRRAATCGCVPIRSASFVSVLADADAIRRRGLPLADYFLWNDDFEFTTRLIRGGVGLLSPASVVEHHTRTFGSTDVDPGERFFFEVRNKTWTFTRSSGLAPLEKVVYGAATGLRWGRTLATSRRRKVLLGCLCRGLVEGLRAGPRPTDEVLADVAVTAGQAP